MFIIGIDPGISGAICFFENGKIIEIIDMPNMTASSTLDLPYKQSSTLGVLYTPLRSLYLASEIVVDTDKGQVFPRVQVRYRW